MLTNYQRIDALTPGGKPLMGRRDSEQVKLIKQQEAHQRRINRLVARAADALIAATGDQWWGSGDPYENAKEALLEAAERAGCAGSYKSMATRSRERSDRAAANDGDR